MIFISFFWDIYLWSAAYAYFNVSVYYFNYYINMGIIFFIYWLFLPLGFLQGLILGIPSAMLAVFGYIMVTGLFDGFWALAN